MRHAIAQVLTKGSRPLRTHRWRRGERRIIYHRVFKPRWINVILCEPRPGEYVWMCMYLRPRLRNRQICRELMRYILYLLPGRHYIHMFPQITSLVQLAREEGWRYRGRSEFFNGCVAYETSSLDCEPPVGPLLRDLLEHRTDSRRPWLPTFGSSQSATRAIRRIRRHFWAEVADRPARR